MKSNKQFGRLQPQPDGCSVGPRWCPAWGPGQELCWAPPQFRSRSRRGAVAADQVHCRAPQYCQPLNRLNKQINPQPLSCNCSIIHSHHSEIIQADTWERREQSGGLENIIIATIIIITIITIPTVLPPPPAGVTADRGPGRAGLGWAPTPLAAPRRLTAAVRACQPGGAVVSSGGPPPGTVTGRG